MATIKSYTDLEQSKKLAKFLPIESADMWFANGIIVARNSVNEPDDIKSLFPCWSLAALLDVIPEIINFEDDESDYAFEMLIENGLYYLSYGNPLEDDKLNIEPQENFVDACVAMIEKLHELNLL